MRIFLHILVLSMFQDSAGLMCYKQEIKLREKEDDHTLLEPVNCDRSCHTTAEGTHDNYTLTFECDKEEPSHEGCSIRQDGSEHCTCYLDGCNKPNITKIRTSLKFKEDYKKKNLKHVKCNSFIANLEKGQVIISSHYEVNCSNSCHTFVLKEANGVISGVAGCNDFGISKEGCEMNGDDMDCSCTENLCNSIPDSRRFDVLADKYALKVMERKMIICMKFEGYFNTNSGTFVFDSKSDILCHSNCTTSIVNDNVRIYTVNGGCLKGNEHLRTHQVTVSERMFPGGWFSRDRTEKTDMSCMAHSDGSSRFITCTCAENECNDPKAEDIRNLVEDYRKHISS